MTMQDEYDNAVMAKRLKVLTVVLVLMLGTYFVRRKVQNDSAIARDTERAALALERISHSSRQIENLLAARLMPEPGAAVQGGQKWWERRAAPQKPQGSVVHEFEPYTCDAVPGGRLFSTSADGAKQACEMAGGRQ